MAPAPAGAAIYCAPFQEGAAGSRALLLQAAQRCAGLSARELGPVETGPWGKPRFSRLPRLHFSVSHSGHWWLCAFSGQPLGLDLQIHRSYTDPARLSRRFLHPKEDAYLAQNGYRDFFDLWAAKESWVKLTGRGFYDDPASFSVVSPQGHFPAVEGACLRLLPFRPGYSLCLCAREVLVPALFSL